VREKARRRGGVRERDGKGGTKGRERRGKREGRKEERVRARERERQSEIWEGGSERERGGGGRVSVRKKIG
jgi:hypothetical protein